jgi:carbon monoxide dehydrogenase subunit G
MHIERTIDLDAGPAWVWALLTEPDQVKRWIRELVDDVPTTPPPVGVGTTTRMTIREGSRTVEYATEILVFELQRELVLEMRGGSLGAHPMRISYRLDPHDAGTRLTYRSSWRPSGILLWLLLPLITVMGRRNLRRSLGRLAELAREPTRRLAHAT